MDRPSRSIVNSNTPSGSRSAGITPDDSRVVAALREYLALDGQPDAPDLSEFLARHAAIAEPLAAALDGLKLMNHVAAGMKNLPRPPRVDLGEVIQPTLPLGDFRIIREVGRGGMGVVYEAEQLSLGRRVALKVLPFAAALDAKQLARFKNEAYAAAHLHHTNIVPVFAVGSDRGVHYYAMQFIDGQTLADLVREKRREEKEANPGPRPAARDAAEPASSDSSSVEPPHTSWVDVQAPDSVTAPYQRPPGSPLPAPAEAPTTQVAAAPSTRRSTSRTEYYKGIAKLGLQAAEALEYAHSMGVIHRDIKPANMLLDSRGNLWVTDFGLAQFRRDGELTLSGDLLGTARYMSPEQTRGERGRVDHHTDIYSLGVTLYEVLTLRHAFDGQGWNELLRQIASDEPIPPRRLRPDIPVELEIIVQKAMSKAPADRYATAAAFAEDLRRFLDDRPILARRPTLLQMGSKWARRHRAILLTAVGVLALAFIALSWFYFLLYQESQATLAALKERETSDTVARLAVDDMYMGVAEKWLKDQPEFEDLQREFLTKARDFYARLSRERGQQPHVRLRRAVALCRVAELDRLARKFRAADEALAEALPLLRDLVRAHPANRVYQTELAKALNTQGLVALEVRELIRSAESFEAALALDRGLVLSAGPGEILAAKVDLANHLANLGQAQLRLRQFDLASANLLASMEQFSDLEKNHRASPPVEGESPEARLKRNRDFRLEIEPAKAMVYLHLGMLRHEMGKLAEAAEYWDQSVGLIRDLADDFPYQFKYRSRQAEMLKQIGQRCYEARQFRVATAYLRQSLSLYEGLAGSIDVPQHHREVAVCLDLLAKSARERGRLADAIADREKELAIRERLAGSSWDDRKLLGISRNNLGHLLLETGKVAQAVQAFQDALNIEMENLDRFQAAAEDRHRMAVYRNNLGKALRLMGRVAEASENYRQAVALSDEVLQEVSGREGFRPVVYRETAASLHRNFASFLIEQGQLREAEHELREAMAQELKLRTEGEHEPRWYVLCVQSHLRLARLYEKQRQPGLAWDQYLAAESVLTEMLQRLPDHPEALNRLAWFRAACPESRLRDLKQARLLAAKALAGELGTDSALPDAKRTLGVVALRSGKYQAAIDDLEEALRHRDRADPVLLLACALAHARAGQQDQAARRYAEACKEWRNSGQSDDDEFTAWRDEFLEAFPALAAGLGIM